MWLKLPTKNHKAACDCFRCRVTSSLRIKNKIKEPPKWFYIIHPLKIHCFFTSSFLLIGLNENCIVNILITKKLKRGLDIFRNKFPESKYLHFIPSHTLQNIQNIITICLTRPVIKQKYKIYNFRI
jgi:hypothetical protein